MKNGLLEEAPKLTNLQVEALIKNGIPVQCVEFHKTIRSYGQDRTGTPEMALYAPEPGLKRARTALMWYTAMGVVAKQAHGSVLIPLANVSFARFE
jgi:hypothetical protein